MINNDSEQSTDLLAIERTYLKEIQDREERFNLVIQGTNDGVWDWNVSTGSYYFSERWIGMLGYQNNEIETNFHGWIKLIHPDDLGDFLIRWTDAAVNLSTHFVMQYRLLHKNGHYLWVEGRSILLFDEDDEPYRMAGSITDINERKKSEAQIKEKNLALEDSLKKLKATQDYLVQSETIASLGRMVAGFAHEINTPVGNALTAISYISDLDENFVNQVKLGLKKSSLDQYLMEISESHHIVSNSLEQAAKMVKSLKKIAIDEIHDEIRSFNLADYLSEVLLSLRPKLKRTHHKIEINCDKGLILNSYPGAIAQIVTNFIINSLMHAYDEGVYGVISLQVIELSSEIMRITYRDDGKGVSEVQMSRIFEPFFTTAREKGGSGLGLSLVFNLVQQKLKGVVTCDSTLGEGVCFTVDIPNNIEI